MLVGLIEDMELHDTSVQMVSTAKIRTASDSGTASSLSCDVCVVSLRTLAGPAETNNTTEAVKRRQGERDCVCALRPLTDYGWKLQLRSDLD